ncbi:MAG TPA: hypothetical protein VFB06_34400 [Streptosporangiaceae bacterium]|nr:hypothetical protein [Streptosporangiaceae bacterium]
MPAQAGEIESDLKKSGQVTLTASGGVLSFDPDHANQRWEVSSVVCKTNQSSTATTVPVVTLALNTTAASTMSDGNNQGQSWNGNQVTFRGLTLVGPCDFLSVLWTPPAGQSGTPLVGVVASAVVMGKKYTRRK